MPVEGTQSTSYVTHLSALALDMFMPSQEGSSALLVAVFQNQLTVDPDWLFNMYVAGKKENLECLSIECP